MLLLLLSPLSALLRQTGKWIFADFTDLMARNAWQGIISLGLSGIWLPGSITFISNKVLVLDDTDCYFWFFSRSILELR